MPSADPALTQRTTPSGSRRRAQRALLGLAVVVVFLAATILFVRLVRTVTPMTPVPPMTHAVVRIGPVPVEFRVEVAKTAEQQRAGLGGRDELPAGTGMLFRFTSHAEQQVWMAGMTFPLDVAWIADGRVLAIDTLTPCQEPDKDTCPRWTSPSPADALLEVSARSITDRVIPGMAVTIDEGP